MGRAAGFVPPVEFVRAVPLLWAWLLVVLAAPLVAMRANYEWCDAAQACVWLSRYTHWAFKAESDSVATCRAQ